MLLKASTIRIFVNRFKEAVSFYQDILGFKLEFTTDEYAQFEAGGIKLAIEYVDPNNIAETKEHVGRFIGLSFEVDDIEEVYRILKGKNVRFTGKPELMPWGGKLTHFYDVDSNCLSLVERSLGA